jgi:histidyl-tRNA synthetase
VKAALKLGVPYLLFIGEEEIKNKTFILRKVENQEEETLTAAAIIEKLSS